MLAEAQLECECVELLFRVMQAFVSAGAPALLRQSGTCLGQLLARLQPAKASSAADAGESLASTSEAAVALMLGVTRAQVGVNKCTLLVLWLLGCTSEVVRGPCVLLQCIA